MTQIKINKFGHSLTLILWSCLQYQAGNVYGQCNGPPVYILPNNSTGNLAFPKSNLDLITGSWQNNHFYPSSITCTWIILAPPLHVLYTKFLHFDTEEGYDFVSLYGSLNEQHQLIRLSGTLKEDWEAVTPDNVLVVHFYADDRTTRNGFHLAFRYMPKACITADVVVDEPQLIAMPPWNLQGILPGPIRPGFEPPSIGDDLRDGISSQTGPRWMDISNYPQGFNCTWNIRISPKELLRLDVIKFHTDADDILQVWKLGGPQPTPLAKYWLDQVPQRRIHSSDPLILEFNSIVSRHESPGSGFLLNVTYISRACSSEPQELKTPKGFIAYPSGNLEQGVWELDDLISYGPDSCEWHLTAPEGYSFNITILEFDTSPQDQLVIYDGMNKIFTHGGATPIKPTVLSTSNSVVVQFHSEADTKKTGFYLQYSWLLRDCRYDLTEPEGEIHSPFFPDTYGSNVRCQWRVTAKPGQVVHFMVAGIRMDQGDYLQITDGNKTKFLTQTSLNNRIMEFNLNPSVEIKFVSDDNLNKGYFLLKYITFYPGSCNFTLTSCGWTSVGRLKVWTLKEQEGLMSAQEENALGVQLPRGYESQLVSPLINPSFLPSSDGAATTQVGGDNPVCIRVRYFLSGQDAYQLSFSLEEEQPAGQTLTQAAIPTNLLSVHGPHGQYFLTAAVNFTVRNPFKVMVNYMKGYGPHYRVGLQEILLHAGNCGDDVTNLSSFSCGFLKTFCGWKNTHMDDQNWQLGETGVSSLISEKLGIPSHGRTNRHRMQTADLLSPVVSVDEVLNGTAISQMCLSLSYEIHLLSADLSVILVPDHSNKGLSQGQQIWGVGRAQTEGIHVARIPLLVGKVPPKFKIFVRATSTGENISPRSEDWNEIGVTLRKTHLDRGACPHADLCSFDDGFCSWQVSYTGATVWHILKTFDGNKNESVAAVLSEGKSTDHTEIISPRILGGQIPKYLSFKYRIHGTSQCLRAAVFRMPSNPKNIYDEASRDTESVIWEQCRRKGSQWLQGCANIPLSLDDYKIVMRSQTGHKDSLLWLDDLQIVEGRCSVTQPQIEPQKSLYTTPYWECRPKMSLCGMSQPPLGSWDWIYVQDAKAGRANTSNQATLDFPTGVARGYFCNNGQIINIEAHCDGFADCPTGEDELHCDGLNEPFVCVNGDIISRQAKCNGFPDCIGAEDELHCTPEAQEPGIFCEEGSFPCPSGRSCPSGTCPHQMSPCLMKDELCDGKPDCKFGEDENECTGIYKGRPNPGNQLLSDAGHPSMNQFSELNDWMGQFEGRMECSGGLMIPMGFRCDGRKDCPMDGLDEVGCFHCSLNDYLCPTSGVCLRKSAVCDGEKSVPTCTDEDDCLVCPPAHFACDVCIKSYQVCDGVWDCNKGEDEERCSMMPAKPHEPQSIHPGGVDTFLEEIHTSCSDDQFTCLSGRCIQKSFVCNRKQDCQDNEDEANCDDDNHEEKLYISAKPWTVRVGARDRDSPSYLFTPILHHLKGSSGLLSFRYRLDSWIGSSNVTLSIEMIHPNDSSLSLLPWSIWRQSGTKGRFWLEDQVIIPDLDNLDSFRIGFLLSGSGSSSDQLHLARLSYRMLENKSFLPIGEERVSCKFKRSWCGWTQPYSERGYSWVYSETSPHARRTGPITGYYDGTSSGFVYADSLYGREGDVADLISPPILLPSPDDAVCFRFAVFLYGAHVAKVSVHSYQTTPGKPQISELFHAIGAKGLSWVPASVSVSKSSLTDPNQPFFLIVRATKGSGPEGDIALDDLSILSGPCDKAAPNYNNILLKPALDPSSSSANFLKAGSSFTRFIQDKGLPSQRGSLAVKNMTISTDICLPLSSCSECVSSKSAQCSWCELSFMCFDEASASKNSCPPYKIIHHNSSKEITSGPSWCPRMVPGKNSRILVPVHSAPSLTFAVTNIQVGDAIPGWTCAYTVRNAKDPNPSLGSGLSQAPQSLPLNAPFLNEELRLLQVLSENHEDENLWLQLKGLATRHVDVTNLKPHPTTIEVPGSFQGSVLRTGEDAATSGVGIGAIECDSSDKLFTASQDDAEGQISVALISPSGYALDNPEDIHLIWYQCSKMAKGCKSCLQLNESYSCGWCSTTQECGTRENCKGGMWNAHSSKPDDVCSVQEEFSFLNSILHEDFNDFKSSPPNTQNWDDLEKNEEDEVLEEEADEITQEETPEKTADQDTGGIFKKSNKKKVKKSMKKFLGHNRAFDDAPSRRQNKKKKGRNKSRGKGDQKNVKLSKKTRSRGFLRVPTENGVYVARDVWRLHTGRQYYIPVKRKTLVNLGFVRQITYGSLDGEKSRTILLDSAWKKAAGYYIDMYEKADQDPVTSIVTTNKVIFDQLITQLLPE